MSSEAMEVVNRWRASNFERRAVEDVLAEDAEWVVPEGGGVTTLRGIDAVLGWYEAGGAADEGASEDLGGTENVDVSEERGELEDFGEGRVGSLNRLIYTWKKSRAHRGEVAADHAARVRELPGLVWDERRNSPSRWRFRPPNLLTVRFRVEPSGGVST